MSLTSLNGRYQKAAQVGIIMQAPLNAHAAYVQDGFMCKPQKVSTPNTAENTGPNPPPKRNETYSWGF